MCFVPQLASTAMDATLICNVRVYNMRGWEIQGRGWSLSLLVLVVGLHTH